MKRKFSRKERLWLAILAGWRCQICGTSLTFDFHGDHIVPFARNGATLLRNGQALCPNCNLRKGVHYEPPTTETMAD